MYFVQYFYFCLNSEENERKDKISKSLFLTFYFYNQDRDVFDISRYKRWGLIDVI